MSKFIELLRPTTYIRVNLLATMYVYTYALYVDKNMAIFYKLNPKIYCYTKYLSSYIQ